MNNRTTNFAKSEILYTDGKSANQIGLEAGVSHAVILRFVSNERDLRLETADKIAAVVGLSVASPSPSRKPQK
jgi:plasmid maintenance system antidote protein VapI